MSGCPPIRATKARYFEDAELKARLRPPPSLETPPASPTPRPPSEAQWSEPPIAPIADTANAGIRREQELPDHEEIVPRDPAQEFELPDDKPADRGARLLQRRFGDVARQAALDPATIWI